MVSIRLSKNHGATRGLISGHRSTRCREQSFNFGRVARADFSVRCRKRYVENIARERLPINDYTGTSVWILKVSPRARIFLAKKRTTNSIGNRTSLFKEFLQVSLTLCEYLRPFAYI